MGKIRKGAGLTKQAGKGGSIRSARGETPEPGRLNIRTVLAPVDFSPLAGNAIAAALPLLQEFGADLHLVHVAEPEYPIYSLTILAADLTEAEIEKQTRARLRKVSHENDCKVHNDHLHVRSGRPYEEICRLARELDADLIVTSTHGWTGLSHLLMGSTAERVVRYSPCPVLVVRAPDGEKKTARIVLRKIVVPVDFSAPSAEGLTFARSLARFCSARLVLLHSVDLRFLSTSAENMRYDFPQLLQAAENAAREQIDALVRTTDWAGVSIETTLETGHPGDQICRRAEVLGADLIVTSTHGRTGLKHALLGSTAEYVVRHARCPVLVVPSHDR